MQWIPGSSHKDHRGVLRFVNDFDMTPVKRAYLIEHPDTQIIRAWQGHQQEYKWFYPVNGIFEIALVCLDNWEQPSHDLQVHRFELNAGNPGVLEVPGGYVNGFRALTEGAQMMVFSNFTTAQSKADDFRFPDHYWNYWKQA